MHVKLHQFHKSVHTHTVIILLDDGGVFVEDGADLLNEFRSWLWIVDVLFEKMGPV